MDEKKKFTFTIVFGLALLWLIFTNFCLPTLKDNTERLAEYKKLREDTNLIEGLNEEKFQAWDQTLSAASSNLEKRFLLEGKMRLAEELTRSPAGSGIVFLDIKQRDAEARGDYEAFPVDVMMKAKFPDLIRYIAMIESNPLFIGMESLRVNKATSEAKDLDVRVTFVGFRLLPKLKSVSAYLEERFHSFDEGQLKGLTGPIATRPAININSVAGLYNPFLSIYDSSVGQRKVTARAGEELSLRGTLRIDGKNIALINDDIVREGQQIGGVEVVQIGDGKVVLIRPGGERQTLKMGVKDGFSRE